MQPLLSASLLAHPRLGRSSVLSSAAKTAWTVLAFEPQEHFAGQAVPLQTCQDWCRAKQKERIFPREWRKPHPAQSLEGLGAACLPDAFGLRAALDFEPLGWRCFFFFRSSSGYFSLLPHKWRLARFLASGLHLFQGNICRLVQASRRIVAACPACVAPWGGTHPAWLRLPAHPSPSPWLLLRPVTCSHHHTRGLTQADLCSA